MNKLRNYIDLALFATIGILLMITQCGGPKVNNSSSSVVKTDTLISFDTIDRPYEVIHFKPMYYPKYDTIVKVDTSIDNGAYNYLRTYNDSISDTNLTIYSRIRTIGILESSKLSYRLKTPLKIIETKQIHDSVVTILPNRFSIYTGVELAGNQSSFNLSPFVTLNVKKVSLTVGYGIIDKTYQVGVGYRIFRSRK